jgi:hypothetical protein
MSMANPRGLVFEGLSGRLEIPPEEWAEMLLLLLDWGGRPEQLRMWYLGPSLQVSDSDSHNLATVGQRVLDTALKDPLAVYPVKFNMAKFYEFIEFCKAGAFRGSQ